MTDDSSPEFAQELLDDFYAECDEQLGVLRDLLTGLETTRADPAPSCFEPLFRTMHSLKGNAAIVGLRAAEELAHVAESYLKGLTRGELALSDAGLEKLLQTVQRLESIIGAHRQRSPIPAVADLVDGLKQFASPAPATPATDAPPPAPAGEASTTPPPTPAGDLYRFTFSPSNELDARGVNLDAVRARLGALGTVRSSHPVIKTGGMTFEFVVETSTPPDAADWLESGVTLAPISSSDATIAASSVESPVVPSSLASEPLDLPAAEDQGASLFIAPSHIVRVDIGRLDDLLRIAGELVIHRSRLEDRLNHGITDSSALKEVNLSLTRSLRELREAITRVRLVPVAEVFARLPFVVRDLARSSTKKARLIIEGRHTEIDKFVVERLKEPLLHLVRNAFSHGIETPDERLAAGKPAEGAIVLSAAAEGGFVIIKIRDDGRGVDARNLVSRAQALGVSAPPVLDDKAILDLLCTPGFSTREETDRAAGRGVGMSVVRDVVQDLGGNLSLQSVPGRSTQFTLRLPLTLSIVETVLFSVAGQTCAVPQNLVQEIIETAQSAIQPIRQTLIIPYRNGVLPVVRLGNLFGATTPTPPASSASSGTHATARSTVPVIVIRSEAGFAGLVIDRVVGQREVVVRPMDDPLIQAPGILGATELGDGRPVLILDALTLLEGAIRPLSASERTEAAALIASSS